MRTLLQCIPVLLFIVSAQAIEPAASDTQWDKNLTVSKVVTGDFGSDQGALYIYCTNGNAYVILLGTEWASLAYSTAMTAHRSGKRIDVLRHKSNGPATGSYWCYRVAYHS